MSPGWVPAAYGVSLVLVAAALHYWHERSWYWHALSITAAMILGLAPFRLWEGPSFDLAVGFAFTFLFLWGLGGLTLALFHPPHLPRHR
ncbi:MAG: hypothetical protein HY013_15250 [Candidatus Solibacter usitatus]|nr:hypothetical protein [Candidatus Solibacter usitatus]